MLDARWRRVPYNRHSHRPRRNVLTISGTYQSTSPIMNGAAFPRLRYRHGRRCRSTGRPDAADTASPSIPATWLLLPSCRGWRMDRIDFIHPVVGLPERIVWIATARPVTERHRGRDTGLAGMNLFAEFGSWPREIEDIDRKSHIDENRLGKLDQAPGLRHLAGTGMLAARRAVDDENARHFIGIVMPPLCLQHGLAGCQPVHCDLVAGIGKAGTSPSRHRRLPRMAIGVPCRRDDRLQFAL